jgi:acetyl-CoA carboxylase biotin carboxyl carrier protein
MELEDIERILALVREHDLSEFELERDGMKVRIRKSGTGSSHVVHTAAVAHVPAAPPALPAAAPPTAQTAASAPATPAEEPEATSVELAVVKSPIVGTFYRSSEPGAAAFVEVGDRVKKDQVLCIIEAMKLMNEITSEYDGEITNIYVENGKPVQYGERLFAIKTA